MKPSRARRVVAAVTGLWLVVFGVLGARHEARVAHYVDARTGEVFHASALVTDHTCPQSDFHELSTLDHDACAVSATLHQAARSVHAQLQISNAPEATLATAELAARSAVALQAVYRLAPKTSPPVIA